MKQYRNGPNAATRIITVIAGLLGTMSLYFEDLFPWSTGAFFGVVIGFLLLVLFSPLKYDSGAITLLINEDFIQKQWLGIRVCTIKRRETFAFCRSILGIYYIVFSKTDLRQAKVPAILWSLARRRAMLYPYDSSIVSDFPDLFAQ